MARPGPILRAPALIAAGSLAVHEGRYIAGYGGGAGEAQAAQGHAYLWDAVVPAVQALLLLSAIALFAAFFRALRGADPEPQRVGFRRAWLRSTLALQAVYITQETLEGWLAGGHPAGVAGVLGHGGWTALVIAVVVGALVALLLRGAAAAVRWAADTAARTRLSPAAAALARRPLRLPLTPSLAPAAPLARGDAGRAPPTFA